MLCRQPAARLHAHVVRSAEDEDQAYSVDVGGKLAGEDEAINALLQAGNVHDLHKVSLYCAQLLGIAHPLVL